MVVRKVKKLGQTVDNYIPYLHIVLDIENKGRT